LVIVDHVVVQAAVSLCHRERRSGGQNPPHHLADKIVRSGRREVSSC
jgi:hypothetical protein